MKFLPQLILVILFLILVLPISTEASPNAVGVSFEVKDGSGISLKDALIIIQGITNPNFDEIRLTDSNGRASFTLGQNEFFIYIVYKSSYKTNTNGFFTDNDKNFQITLERLPENQWDFYYVNNGELELRFNVRDDDTNYELGDHIKPRLEIRNVADREVKLIDDKNIFKIVDGETFEALDGWGDFELSKQIDVDVTLKRGGWIRGTLSETNIEVCAGNVRIIYNGDLFDLDGPEFLCLSETQDYNKIPDWVPKNNYRFELNYVYEIGGQEKNIGFSTQEFFINGQENNPPVVTSEPITEINENEVYSYQVTATDENGDVLTYSLTQAPEWLSINNNTGLISGTAPEVGTDEPFNVTIRVSDGTATATQTYNLNVINIILPNNPPIINSTPLKQVNEESAYIYDVEATDSDNDVLSYSFSGPSWLSINTSNGVITGTALSVNADTIFNVTVQVSDGTASVSQSYILTVINVPIPVNNPPIIISTAITEVNENEEYFYDVDATDADGDTLTYSLTQAPSWLSINPNSGLISGTSPSINANADFNITITVSDGVNSVNQSYILTVVDIPIPNTPPIANNQNVVTNQNSSLSITLTGSDSDGFLVSCTVSTQSSHGTISGISQNGCQLTYTPNTNYTGSDSFTFRVTDDDGAVSSPATVSITVNPVIPTNNPPVITSTPITQVNEEANYVYQVTATDTDNDTLTYSLAQAPSWLSINALTGLISGTAPVVSENTIFTIIVQASDGRGGIVTQTYILTANDIPTTDGGTRGRSGIGLRIISGQEFEEQKYLEQFNPQKNILNDIPAISPESLSSNKLKEILMKPIYLLIVINLSLTILIVLTIFIRTRK